MFNFFKKKNEKEKQDSTSELKALIKTIHNKTHYVLSANDLKDVEEYKELKAQPADELKQFISKLLDHYTDLKIKASKTVVGYSYNRKIYLHYACNIIDAMLAGIMRKKLDYTEEEWMALFEQYCYLDNKLSNHHTFHFNLSSLPINHSIKQIEYYLKTNSLSAKLKNYIESILAWEVFKDTDRYSYGSDMTKALKKLEALIHDGEEPPFKIKTNDIGDEVNEVIAGIKNNATNYNRIFHLAAGVSGSKPTVKFSKAINLELDKIGLDNYRTTVHKLLATAIKKEVIITTKTNEWNGNTYTYTESSFLTDKSQNFIKGLAWTCGRFSDKETILLMTSLAEKCYKKIPGKGPAAASIGNACVKILGNMKGKDGLGALSRLKLKVRQNNVRKSIDKLLLEGAKKYKVSVEELKEMAVPHYGMVAGVKNIEFGEYKLKISIQGAKVIQQWIKPDGSSMKSVPSIVKNTPALKKKLADARKEVKEIQKVFSAQKQRIDNQFILDRSWDYTSFKKYYLDHGLVFPIASKLIWSFGAGKEMANGIWQEGGWKTLDGKNIDSISEDTKVKLWHPVVSTEDEIVAWREKMIALEWKQPIKQAFRELYILTEAEINTKSYSNRMAAHILKQHQFNSLASIRDWKYALMGSYDDGRDNSTCSKYLPEHGIVAEYWIDELIHDDAFNEAGIWLYVATDQVKFKDEDGNTLDLIDVPKMVFTEIMRDVDLFVGVASVGNDPQWMDNNGERREYRDYWQSYSFGDLNEIAKTRKEILQGLLPRLKKIRDKAEIVGKFLIIKGQVRTYKIHIGSGNILMEPNDQYLCIVPSRSADTATKNIFIPFEGDRGLSIVLSKAFLLAEDDKIEDGTIISQINRK